MQYYYQEHEIIIIIRSFRECAASMFAVVDIKLRVKLCSSVYHATHGINACVDACYFIRSYFKQSNVRRYVVKGTLSQLKPYRRCKQFLA